MFTDEENMIANFSPMKVNLISSGFVNKNSWEYVKIIIINKKTKKQHYLTSTNCLGEN